jgi:RNA:NAD 2'-phosphotransferase (TPT1/KptA family)
MHDTNLSKTLSYWLRHAPEAGGLAIDAHGSADVDAVLTALDRRKIPCDRKRLRALMTSSDKRRFELSPMRRASARFRVTRSRLRMIGRSPIRRSCSITAL